MYSLHSLNISWLHVFLLQTTAPNSSIFILFLCLPSSALGQYDPPGSLQDGLSDQRWLRGGEPLSGLHQLWQRRWSRRCHPNHGGVVLKSHIMTEWKKRPTGRREKVGNRNDGSWGVKLAWRSWRLFLSSSFFLHIPLMCHFLSSIAVKYHKYCY